MNLILTSACNKRCSFCFAKSYIENPDTDLMTLDMAKSIVYERLVVQKASISLLGGEPTIYPFFEELLEYIYTLKSIHPYTPSVLLVSNFLFEDPNTGSIIKKLSQEGMLSFLLNVAEMSEKQMILFQNNLQYLAGSDFTPGITFSTERSSGYYINILSQIITGAFTQQASVDHLRISLPNPTRGSVDFEEAKKTLFPPLRSMVKDILHWATTVNIGVTFDCGTPYCFLKEDADLIYLLDILRSGRELSYGCNGSALDLKPTGELISCYPGESINLNIKDYNNLASAEQSLQVKRRNELIKYLPASCTNCSDYMINCKGPCMGYYSKKDTNNGYQ